MYAMPRFSIFIITGVAGALFAVAPPDMFRPWSGGPVPHATVSSAFSLGSVPATIILKTIAVQKPIVLRTIPVLVPPRVFEIERGRPSPAQPITCESHPTIVSAADRLLGPCYA
jgi:hypothetical protein